jgi:hypothetical protein
MNRFMAVTIAVVLTTASLCVVNIVHASSNTSINACANKTTGALRLLTKGSCKKTEKKISWNQQGPMGPMGPQGASGSPTTNVVPIQQIGDVGAGGGTIFYVDTLDQYPFQYLEVAPTNATESSNNCSVSSLTSTNSNQILGSLSSDALGQGRTSTMVFLSICNGPNGQPSGYEQLVPQIRQGWFIPNTAEMRTLVNAEKLGLINLANPLRPSTPGRSLLMTSTPSVSSSMDFGVPFWSWEFTNSGQGTVRGNTGPIPMTTQTVRLIKAG